MNEHKNYFIYAVVFLISLNIISAQIPDKFTNLTLLPKEIDKDHLIDVMKNFTSALGVRCNFCHAGKEGIDDPKSLSDIDFASDKIPAKDITRVMMKMTHLINTDQLTQIKEKEHIDKINCVTCHKGMEHPPKPLEDILKRQAEKNGIEAAVKKYDELREKYYGGFVYDFTFNSLDAFTENLIQSGKSSDVVAFFNAYLDKYDKNSWNAYFEIGKAYAGEKKYEEAKKNLDKALEISPDNGMVKWFYGRLKQEEGQN